MADKLKAYLLMRLSQKKQQEKYGIDAQRRDAYVSASDCPLPIELSRDRETIIIEPASGWSRKKFAMEMQRRMEEFSRGEWEVLVYPRGDRESRFLAGSFEYLTAAIKTGIPIWFARDRLLLTNEQTEEAKLAWDKYLDLIRDARSYIRVLRANTQGGRDAAMDAGRIPTGWGPKGLSGYGWKGGCFYKNEVASTVERILRLYLKGDETQSSITRKLHGLRSQTGTIWYQSSVGKVLRHARWYGGVITYKGREFKGLIDPIITESEAELILKRLGHRSRPTAYGRAHWLTGRVRCGLCERSYSISRSHGCRCNLNDSRLPEPCHAPSLGYDEFIGLVQGAVRCALVQPESLIDAAGRRHDEWVQEREILKAELQEKESTLAEYESRKKRLRWQHEHTKLSNEDLLAGLAKVEDEEGGHAERVKELRSLLDAEEPPKPEEIAECVRYFTLLFDESVSMEDKLKKMPDLSSYARLQESIRPWTNSIHERDGVVLTALDVNERPSPDNSPSAGEMWRRLADRLNLQMIIYPPKEPGRKADIRVIGEFNPLALGELDLPGGAATVNTLSLPHEPRRHHAAGEG
jgi:hypothetical protein